MDIPPIICDFAFCPIVVARRVGKIAYSGSYGYARRHAILPTLSGDTTSRSDRVGIALAMDAQAAAPVGRDAHPTSFALRHHFGAEPK
jgi:hypothetical protein